jgi:vacuolar-type H+-ATPase subunit H
MRELDSIMAEVRDALAAKENEINKAGNCAIAFVKDAFTKRRKEVSSFECSMPDLHKRKDSEKHNIVERFRNDAHELIGEIASILV